jgi:predicted transcriptional regulator
MTVKQKLILFLISCEPGIRDIYTMVRVYDKANFPFDISVNLEVLLSNNLIFVVQNFENGTANKYEITEDGKVCLEKNCNDKELINYINTLEQPDQILQIVNAYMKNKNSL